jgi:hypothetical protein
VNIFSSTISKDVRKKTLAQQATSLEDFQRTLTNAKLKYDNEHKGYKVSKWLIKCSCRIRYYGNIMDVLVQQQPEYVGLAWGTMKLLFIVSHVILQSNCDIY